MTVVIVIFAEVLPKTYAINRPNRTALLIAPIIYYLNNFFNVMGSSEKIPLFVAIWFPLIFLTIANSIFLLKINEK